MRRTVCMMLFATVACAKADRPPQPPVDATPPTAQPAPEGDGHAEGEAEHPKFEGAVAQFHDAMAPLWHAEAGDKRTQDTCTAIDDMLAKANAVEPDGALVKATDALKTECAGDKANFDAAFKAVHDAFHEHTGAPNPGQ